MRTFGIIWVHLCVALLGIVCLTGLANAQCSPQGWALGTATMTEAHYVAEGPANAWVNKGWTDPQGVHFQIDNRLSEAGVLLLRVVEPGKDPKLVPLMRYEGRCGYTSEISESGNMIVFGNLVSLEDHLHPDVRPFLHPVAQDRDKSVKSAAPESL